MTNGKNKNVFDCATKRILAIATIYVCFIGASFAENSINEKLRYGTMVRDMVMIQAALEAGADPNHSTEGNESPLWIAATDNSINPKVVELLLKKGGNPNQVSSYGTPLLISASRVINPSLDNRTQILKLLLDYGADIEVMDKTKRSRPLTMAATFGSYATLKTLLENGANPNNVPTNGFPALFSLSRNKHCKLDCLELLLAHGADPDLSYKRGSLTYRERAVKRGDWKIIELIEKYSPAKK